MKGLSKRQQQVHDLKVAGRSRAEIMVELGIAEGYLNKLTTTINKKMGVIKKQGGSEGMEVVNPEKGAAGLDALTEPKKLVPLVEALKDAGFPEKAGRAFLARLKRRYPGVTGEATVLKTAEMSDLLTQKIHMALQAMDEHVILEASFRDLALGTTAMIEKRALLRGEPTSIVSDHERKRLHELAPLLLAEIQRRGLTIEAKPMEKVIEPS